MGMMYLPGPRSSSGFAVEWVEPRHGGWHEGRAGAQPLNAQLERAISELGDSAIERLGSMPEKQARRPRSRKQQKVQLRSLLRGVCALQLRGVEPTTSKLVEACRLANCPVSRAQIDRMLQVERLSGLPAAVFQRAMERRALPSPEAVYFKSWPVPAFGPDKFGVDSQVAPQIPAQEVLTLPGIARNCTAASSNAYAIVAAAGQPYVIGCVPVALGWWAPEKWAPYLTGSEWTVENVETQLRQVSSFLDTKVPFVTTAGIMASELAEQIAKVRDALPCLIPLPENLVVCGGEMRGGATHEADEGFGLSRGFASQEPSAIQAVLASGMTPMLDLPNNPLALRDRGGFDHVPWKMGWQLRIGDSVVAIPDLQRDLVAMQGSEPASRWWKPFEEGALKAAGVEGRCRYRWVRGGMQTAASEESGMRALTLIGRRHGGRFYGWVSTIDPRHRDAKQRVEIQKALIERCECQIETLKLAGPVEKTVDLLHQMGWAHRGKRRSYHERNNINALAIAARTLIDLARLDD